MKRWHSSQEVNWQLQLIIIKTLFTHLRCSLTAPKPLTSMNRSRNLKSKAQSKHSSHLLHSPGLLERSRSLQENSDRGRIKWHLLPKRSHLSYLSVQSARSGASLKLRRSAAIWASRTLIRASNSLRSSSAASSAHLNERDWSLLRPFTIVDSENLSMSATPETRLTRSRLNSLKRCFILCQPRPIFHQWNLFDFIDEQPPYSCVFCTRS